MNVLGRVKPLDALLAQGDDRQDTALKKTLGVWGLTALGIGAIVGTGIFVLTGKAAALSAGPAIVISFVIAGVVSALAALCYAELASTVPVVGQRVHLRLRHAGRVPGLDRGLGPDPGVRAGRRDRRDRLVRLLLGLHRHDHGHRHPQGA